MRRLFHRKRKSASHPPETEIEKRRSTAKAVLMARSVAYLVMIFAPFCMLGGPFYESWKNSGIIVALLSTFVSIALVEAIGLVLLGRARRWTREYEAKYPIDRDNADLMELIYSYSYVSKERKEIVRETLICLLNGAVASQERGMSMSEISQIPMLIGLKDRELSLATIAFLERYGDKSSLPKLKVIAQGKFGWSKAPELQSQAEAAISAIENRLKGETPETSLLRGSEQPADPSSLLRSSHASNGDQEVEVLLRSSNGESE